MTKINLKAIKKGLNDWLVWLILISIVGIIFILFPYFKIFGGSFSEDHSVWGEFGGLLGAITGLMAFAGLLFTLRQSNRSEERSVFFDLLKIFVSYKNEIQIKKVENLGRWNFYLSIPMRDELEDYCKPDESINQIAENLLNDFYFKIILSLLANESINKEDFVREIANKTELPQNFTGILSNRIATYCKGMNFNYFYPDDKIVAWTIVQYYINKKDFKTIVMAFKNVADNCYRLYKNQFGTYFRNAFYILQITSKFKSSERYSKIFRAQLSKDELVVLFFNAFSSQSNKETRELYYNADLFNNLSWEDYIPEQLPTTRNDFKSSFIKSLYNEINKIEKMV